MAKKHGTRHFHAGAEKLVVDGEEFVEVSELVNKFVSRAGRVVRRGPGDAGIVEVKALDNGHGYKTIHATMNRQYIHVYIHRLVYEIFVGEIPDGWDVDHVNDQRGDNRLENLCIMTHYDNLTSKASTVANRAKASRESIKKASASQEKPVVAIDADGVERWFKSSMAAARATGTNFTSISMALHGNRIKKAGGLTWRFAGKESV